MIRLLLTALCVLTTNGETTHMIEKRAVFDVDEFVYVFNKNAGCNPNPCYNQGICLPKLNSEFECLCPEPYFGKMCLNVRNVCENTFCFQGSCLVEMNPPYSQCKCRHPFSGPNCLFSEASPCHPSPCLNGGHCFVIPPTQSMQFTCICQTGYTGKYCETGPDDCYTGNGETYRGVTRTTENGEECLYWNDYRVVSIVRDPFNRFGHLFQSVVNGKLIYNNYCRNQNNEERPWCFVMRNGNPTKAFCKMTTCIGDNAASLLVQLLLQLASVTPSPQASFSQCGVENQAVRIIGGTKAVPGAHPWQASLQRRQTGSGVPFEHWCGGTLIASCWVLTAAHCIHQGFDYQVVLGGVNITEHEDMDQIIPVSNSYIHERYSHGSHHSDIALLKLQVTDSPYCAKETPFVKTACLPDAAFPPGTQCVVSGWGATKTNFISDHLLRAKITLISKDVCKYPNILGNTVDETMLCAGVLQGGTDSCQGDSGGPLVCEKDGVKFVTGAVSWGFGCGLRNKPGVYADVFYFKDWIRNKMNGS